MHSDMHHRRSFVWIVLLALLALLLSARPAHSGWSVDPVQIHATSALCPLVAAVDDGDNGALIVWQENTTTGGLLRAKHVLASGDLAPDISTPRAVSSIDRAREALGGVTDGHGGAYVWWMEGAILKLTRLGTNAAVAPGWPPSGRTLASLPTARHIPDVVSDGHGGVYVAWISIPLTSPRFPAAWVIHLGPDNATAGGWPSSARMLGPGGSVNVVEFTNSVAIAAAPDGGLWFACATTVYNEPDFGFAPGVVRLLRLTSAGTRSPGWAQDGVTLGTFHGEALWTSTHWTPYWNPWAFVAPVVGLVAIAPGRVSGAFIARTQMLVDEAGEPRTGPGLLHHVDESGVPTAGWAPEGVTLPMLGFGAFQDAGADGSVRAIPDGTGGVFAGAPEYYVDGSPLLPFQRFGADGTRCAGWFRYGVNGLELASRGDGGMFVGGFKPSGATSMWESDAYISVSQTDGSGFGESVRSGYSVRYGDIGLTATRDGGAIFAWSQLIDRQGVYAIRLNPAGVVTGVNPTIGAASLRLRFVRGRGVLAAPSLPGAAHVTLTLHDLAGRVVSSVRTDDTPGADVLFPGTRDLPGGVYFARASDGSRELHARVVVIH